MKIRERLINNGVRNKHTCLTNLLNIWSDMIRMNDERKPLQYINNHSTMKEHSKQQDPRNIIFSNNQQCSKYKHSSFNKTN